MTSTIAGLQPWETVAWLPSGDDLPQWLVDAKAKHAAALDEYLKAVGGVVDTSAQIDTSARQHRREVRNAVAEGREPPVRQADPDVSDAQREVALEDAQYARDELAVVACEVLDTIRQHREDFSEQLYLASSPELRLALGGFAEVERLRQERQRFVEAEPQIVDLSLPENDHLTKLNQEETHASAA
jgi:hypothetical protein